MLILLFATSASVAAAPQRSPLEYAFYAVLAVIFIIAGCTFDLRANAEAYADALHDASHPKRAHGRDCWCDPCLRSLGV